MNFHKMTQKEYMKLVQAGNKEAVADYEAWLKLLEDKLKEWDPKSKPIHQMVIQMCKSENPVERAIARPWDEMTVDNFKRLGAKLLAEETAMPGKDATVYDWLDWRDIYKQKTGKKITFKELEMHCEHKFKVGYFKQVNRLQRMKNK